MTYQRVFYVAKFVRDSFPHYLLTKQIRIMTNGDIMFLGRLLRAHKEVIREDCARRKLDKKDYFRRIGRAEKRAQQILNRER